MDNTSSRDSSTVSEPKNLIDPQDVENKGDARVLRPRRSEHNINLNIGREDLAVQYSNDNFSVGVQINMEIIERFLK